MSVQGFGRIPGASYTPAFGSNIHTLADLPHLGSEIDPDSTEKIDDAIRALNGVLEARNEQSKVIRETTSQLSVMARDVADRIKRTDELLRKHEEKKKVVQEDLRRIEESNRRFESQRPQLTARVTESEEELRNLRAEADKINGGSFQGSFLKTIAYPFMTSFEWVKKKFPD